jgi:hypothetical protein
MPTLAAGARGTGATTAPGVSGWRRKDANRPRESERTVMRWP